MANHIITTADEPVVFSSPWKSVAVNPGDTVEIQAGTYSDVIKFDDTILGTQANPIIVQNSGGRVVSDNTGAWAFLIEGSEWVEFNFNGDPAHTYGLKLIRRFKIHTGIGISLRWAEINNTATSGIGFHCVQQDADKLIEITDITLEDCYIWGCNGEATYVGSNRNGDASNEKILRRIWQRRIIVEDCYEGVGINSCLGGWEISDCVVINTTVPDEPSHNSAISIGKGADQGIATRNRIVGCVGHGIAINVGDNLEQLSSTIEVSYNEIHAVGTELFPTVTRNNGIHLSSAIPTVNIHNNTITQVGNTNGEGHGIRLGDPQGFAYDNICVDIQDQGISLAASVPAGNAYNNLSNIATQSVDGVAHTPVTIKFVNYANDDFHIGSDSPAVGQSSTGGDIGRWASSESNPGGGSPVELDIQVAGSANDARQLDTGGMNISDTGHTINDPGDYLGFRFQNVQIPQGAVITEAYIDIEVNNTTNDDPNLIIHGEDIDTAPEFAVISNNISDRTKTTANATWNATSIGIGRVNSPSIITIIQEIVDRVGWQSGNNLVLMFEDTGGALRVNTVDKGASSGAILNVTYTSGTVNELFAIIPSFKVEIGSILTVVEPLEALIESDSEINAILDDVLPLVAEIESGLPHLGSAPLQLSALIDSDSEINTSPVTVEQLSSAINSDSEISALLNNINRLFSVIESDSQLNTFPVSTLPLISSIDSDSEILAVSSVDSVAELVALIESDGDIQSTLVIVKALTALIESDSRLDTISTAGELQLSALIESDSEISAILSDVEELTALIESDSDINASLSDSTVRQLSALIESNSEIHAIISVAFAYTHLFAARRKTKIFRSKGH